MSKDPRKRFLQSGVASASSRPREPETEDRDRSGYQHTLPGAISVRGPRNHSPVSSEASEDGNASGEELQQTEAAAIPSAAFLQLSAMLVNEETEAEQARQIQILEEELREARANAADPSAQEPPPNVALAVALDVRIEEEERHGRIFSQPRKCLVTVSFAISLVVGVVVLAVVLAGGGSQQQTLDVLSTQTPSISVEPTLSPSISPPPTQSPTTSPSTSAAPTEYCALHIGDLNLTIRGGEFDGSPFKLHHLFLSVEPCVERPYQITMLYNGGNCSQSDNRQILEFECIDTEFGPPPTEEGARSYIVATDASNKGVTYFRGWVAVGDFYELITPEGLPTVEKNQTISIYSSPETNVRENLLQRVTFDGSCSSNLELKNRFGASQLVGYINDSQGNITVYADFDFDINIEVPIAIEGDEPVRLESLTALGNSVGFKDWSNGVNGTVITPPSVSVIVSLPPYGFSDLRPEDDGSVRVTFLLRVVSKTVVSDHFCNGTAFKVFLLTD